MDYNGLAKIMFMNEENKLNLGSVMQRCFNVVNIIAPSTEIDENVKGWLDDLDFVEIVMETEKEFDCIIEEGDKRICDFDTIRDLVKWLSSNVA